MPNCPKCARQLTSEHDLKIHTSRCRKSRSTAVKPTRDWPRVLVVSLAVLLFANFIVLTFFTVTVGDKLTEAIELTKPQAINLTLIAPVDCPRCRDLESLKTLIAKQNVTIDVDEILIADTPAAQKLITKFAIQKLPALILQSKSALRQPLKTALQSSSREISEAELLWEQMTPPYFDLVEQKTVGLVTITFLTDESCTDCYDVAAIQKPILTRFGVASTAEKTIDRKEAAGQELIQKYAITKVPTVLLSSEAAAYEQLKTIWQDVGSVETDGTFIFREPDLLPAIYRDLTTGLIVKPVEPTDN